MPEAVEEYETVEIPQEDFPEIPAAGEGEESPVLITEDVPEEEATQELEIVPQRPAKKVRFFGLLATIIFTIIIGIPIALVLICIGLPFVFFCLLRGNEYRALLGIRPMKVKHITLSVYSLIFIVSGTMALSLLMYTLFPEAFAASGMDSKNAVITQYTTGDSIYAAVTFAILPAILEEFLFRGILCHEYERGGVTRAIVLSSLFFGMLHFDLPNLPVYIFSGVILAMVMYATRSLIGAIAAHFLYNIFGLFGQPYINTLYRIT